MTGDTISIIIPTLNESEHLAATLKPVVGRDDVEILVVDGGSDDDTCEIASQWGARLLRSEPGRALQMNAGAAAATGNILLFLHADTHLPEDFGALVRGALSQPAVIAGAFQFRLDMPGLGPRLIEWGANLRSRWCRLPYGDQALFTTTAAFRAVDGFPHLPIMEDVALIRRLRRQDRITLLPHPALTSGRRWQHLGFVQTTLFNQLILIAYSLGCPPHRLAAWSSRTRTRSWKKSHSMSHGNMPGRSGHGKDHPAST